MSLLSDAQAVLHDFICLRTFADKSTTRRLGWLLGRLEELVPAEAPGSVSLGRSSDGDPAFDWDLSSAGTSFGSDDGITFVLADDGWLLDWTLPDNHGEAWQLSDVALLRLLATLAPCRIDPTLLAAATATPSTH